MKLSLRTWQLIKYMEDGKQLRDTKTGFYYEYYHYKRNKLNIQSILANYPCRFIVVGLKTEEVVSDE